MVGEEGRGRKSILSSTSLIVWYVASSERFGTRAHGAAKLVGQALRDFAGPRLD